MITLAQNRFIEEISTQKIGEEYELKVERHELANGKTFNYHVFNLPHFSIIFPAGVADNWNEDPKVTAFRELEEETGYVAGNLELIGKFRHTSRSTQYCHSYVASDLRMVGQKLDEGEYIEELLEVTADQIEDFINSEEMVDISHIATWYRYKQLFEENGKT